MTAIERLFQYLDYKQIKPTRFEKNIGLSNGYLGVQYRRKADIGSSIVLKIVEYCRDLDIEWLMTGEGQMIKNLEESSNLEDTNLNSNAMSENHLQKLFEMLESQQRVIASMAESNKQLAEANQIQAQSFQSLIQKLQIEEAPDEDTNTSEGVKKSQAS